MLGEAGFSKRDLREAAEILVADKQVSANLNPSLCLYAAQYFNRSRSKLPQARRSSMRTYGRMQKIDPLLKRVMVARAGVKKVMSANQSSCSRKLLYSDRNDPLNVSSGLRGSLTSNDTVIFLDLDVDTPGE